MGILVTTFAGKNGLSAVLHKTLGETAVIKITCFRKEERTGAIKRFYASYAVPFVPSSTASRKVDLERAVRSDRLSERTVRREVR